VGGLQGPPPPPTNPLAPHSLWMGRDFNRVLTDFMVSSFCMWRKKTLLGG
jgi:hypothetical protein